MEWQDAEDVMESDEDSEDERGTQSNPMKVMMYTHQSDVILSPFREIVHSHFNLLKTYSSSGYPRCR